MASGWTCDGTVQDPINDTVADAVLAAGASMLIGKSEPFCTICGGDIAAGRRRALPGARTCVECQGGRDRPLAATPNRRGSEDIQLW